ncbi:retrovirus-related pol polyprotein from transposon TNT 1-94 [Tanacetum coccineum]
MDLFRPVKPQTISHNKYNFVIVDEYSRYTWVFCLKKKNDVADCIISFIKEMENLNEVRVKELRSDNGTYFRNHKLEEFCDEKVAKAFRDSVSSEDPPDFTIADNHPALSEPGHLELDDNLEPAKIQNNVTNKPIIDIHHSPSDEDTHLSPVTQDR